MERLSSFEMFAHLSVVQLFRIAQFNSRFTRGENRAFISVDLGRLVIKLRKTCLHLFPVSHRMPDTGQCNEIRSWFHGLRFEQDEGKRLTAAMVLSESKSFTVLHF